MPKKYNEYISLSLPELSEKIKKDFLFSYIEIENKALSLLVEGIMIQLYNKQIINHLRQHEKISV